MRADKVEATLAAARSINSDVEQVLDSIQKELQYSGATRLLTGIDICNAKLALTAVGVFSVYEARLENTFKWQHPFRDLKNKLREIESPELADEFHDYYLAINVLKHGTGRSHRELLARAGDLSFVIENEFEDLYEEGDCTPRHDLIRVDEAFLEACCSVVERTWNAVRQDQVWVRAD